MPNSKSMIEKCGCFELTVELTDSSLRRYHNWDMGYNAVNIQNSRTPFNCHRIIISIHIWDHSYTKTDVQATDKNASEFSVFFAAISILSFFLSAASLLIFQV